MKIINDKACTAYTHLINGFNNGDISRGYDHESNNLFVHGAMGQATCGAENPFEKGSREGYLYFRIHYCYGMWKRGGIDAKVNRIRMYRAAAELAAMQLPNPFDYDLEPVIESSEDTVSQEELAESELIEALAEDIASKTFEPAVGVRHILGMLPEGDE